MADTNCPVCRGLVKVWQEGPGTRDGNSYDCPACGEYFISRSAMAMASDLDDLTRAFLSHQIWRNQANDKRYEVTTIHVGNSKEKPLPGPDEQLDNLILFLGKFQEGNLSKQHRIPTVQLKSKTGSLSADDAKYVADEAIAQGLVQGDYIGSLDLRAVLTFDGWKRYRDIEKGRVQSRRVFMAMPFGDPVLVKLVDDYFRPAVEETGFKLRRVDDEPRAGLIDDHIRVEIRMSRFVIADLTGGNLGAYWEGGFAEGQDKPVIYTCSEEWKTKTHFDTNHCHTVFWSPDNPAKAAEDLKATIRATLPYEAVMPPE